MTLHLIVEQYIKNQIRYGEWLEGGMIPPETVLAEQFGVSRPTVRQAMKNLVNEGYLERISGKGSFVKKPKLIQESTRFIESYHVEMDKKGLRSKTSVLALRVEGADPFIAKQLKIKPNDKVTYLKRLRYAIGGVEERPVLLTEVFIPFNLFPELINHNFETEFLYEVLAKRSLSPRKVVREIEAMLCDAHSASLLEISQSDPVQYITSTGYLEDGRVLEYSRSAYPASRNKFIIEIST